MLREFLGNQSGFFFLGGGGSLGCEAKRGLRKTEMVQEKII